MKINPYKSNEVGLLHRWTGPIRSKHLQTSKISIVEDVKNTDIWRGFSWIQFIHFPNIPQKPRLPVTLFLSSRNESLDLTVLKWHHLRCCSFVLGCNTSKNIYHHQTVSVCFCVLFSRLEHVSVDVMIRTKHLGTLGNSRPSSYRPGNLAFRMRIWTSPFDIQAANWAPPSQQSRTEKGWYVDPRVWFLAAAAGWKTFGLFFFETPGEKGGSFVEDLLRNYLKINGDIP